MGHDTTIALPGRAWKDSRPELTVPYEIFASPWYQQNLSRKVNRGHLIPVESHASANVVLGQGDWLALVTVHASSHKPAAVCTALHL